MEYSLLLQKELLYTNATSTFLFQPVYNVSLSQLSNQNSDYQAFIELFQSNYGVHTSSYNSVFESIMFDNVCNQTVSRDLSLGVEGCQTLNRGIQSKGVYSAVVKFWQDL